MLFEQVHQFAFGGGLVVGAIGVDLLQFAHLLGGDDGFAGVEFLPDAVGGAGLLVAVDEAGVDVGLPGEVVCSTEDEPGLFVV